MVAFMAPMPGCSEVERTAGCWYKWQLIVDSRVLVTKAAMKGMFTAQAIHGAHNESKYV